jgi:hypothetical protein
MKILLVAAGDDRKAALATIDAHRHQLLVRLQEVRQRQRAAGAEAQTLGARLVADALAVRAEADLRWLDLCAERLRHRRGGDAEASSGNGRRAEGDGGERGKRDGPHGTRDTAKAKGRRR